MREIQLGINLFFQYFLCLSIEHNNKNGAEYSEWSGKKCFKNIFSKYVYMYNNWRRGPNELSDYQRFDDHFGCWTQTCICCTQIAFRLLFSIISTKHEKSVIFGQNRGKIDI